MPPSDEEQPSVVCCVAKRGTTSCVAESGTTTVGLAAGVLKPLRLGIPPFQPHPLGKVVDHCLCTTVKEFLALHLFAATKVCEQI